jgi:hypothetical protein
MAAKKQRVGAEFEEAVFKFEAVWIQVPKFCSTIRFLIAIRAKRVNVTYGLMLDLVVIFLFLF